jgi:hypothetical protein
MTAEVKCHSVTVQAGAVRLDTIIAGPRGIIQVRRRGSQAITRFTKQPLRHPPSVFRRWTLTVAQ